MVESMMDLVGLKLGDLCPLCEKGKLSEATKDLNFHFKDRSIAFPNESVFVCSICDYEGLGPIANKRIDKALVEFRQFVTQQSN